MTRNIIFDRTVSLKGKGLYFVLKELIDEDACSLECVKQCTSNGTESIRSALKELENTGYLKKERVNGDGGKIRYEYSLDER